MKKIFTLMLTFACALFVGVSCTNDGTTDQPNLPVVTVDAPEEGLTWTNEAGTAELSYVVENAVNGVDPVVAVSEEAAWLTAEVVAADKKVVLTYEANTAAEPRTATVTLSYKGAAEDVVVKVKQNGEVSLTVTGAPEENLAPAGGEFSLAAVLKTTSLTAAIKVAVNEEATWLHVGELASEDTVNWTVPFTYDANTDALGSEPREATITVSVEGVDGIAPYTLTVKQDAQAALFDITWSEVSTMGACASVVATDKEMNWIMLKADSSTIIGQGFDSPEAYFAELEKNFQLPYLDPYFSLMTQGGAYGVGDSIEPAYVQLGGMMTSPNPGDDLYVFVLGYSKVEFDQENMEWDNSVRQGPVHVFKAPLLPMPKVTIAGDLAQNVKSEAGSLTLDVTIENPVADYNIYASTEAAWVTTSYADGKLTLNYEANTTALSRQASVRVEYGKKTFYGDGPDDWYIDTTCSPVEVVLTQEKDPNAQAVTFDIQVVETHFNRIVVNVTPSDKNADYVLSATPATQKNWDTETWDPIEVNWSNVLNTTSLETTYKGDLVNHSIIMSVGNYEWDGYDYYVYAFAVNADKTAPAGEASHTENSVKVDISDMPKLTLVEGNGLAWDAENNCYVLNTNGVEQEYVLSFNVENPVEGAAVTYNSSATGGVIDENLGTDVFGNGDQLVIDNEAKTIKFTVNPYPADWNKTYTPNRTITVFYTLGEEYWGIQAQIKVVLCQPADGGAAVMPL